MNNIYNVDYALLKEKCIVIQGIIKKMTYCEDTLKEEGYLYDLKNKILELKEIIKDIKK